MQNPAPRASDIFVHAPGGRLFVRIWGDLRASSQLAPILLLHDSLGSVEIWRDFPLQLAMATGHPVVAYDRLGFGRSDPHPGVLDTPGFVREEARTSLSALRRELELERMILFGHSVGGAMAIVAASEAPETVAAVMTEAAQVFAEEQTLSSIRAAKEAFAAPDQFQRVAKYHGAKAQWVLNAWTESWLAPAFASWTVEDDLRRLQCPILAIHGDRDEYGTRAHPERIAALVPGPTDLVLLDDCGHVPHRDRPQAVLEAVRTFVSKLPAGGSES